MNNNIPQGYKESPLGVIPQDWEVRRLGEVCSNKGDYGINAPAVDYRDNLPTYIRITDINDSGKYDCAKKASVDSSASDDYILKKGDIVFARTGATVGKTYLYNPNDGVLVYAGFLIKFSPDPNKLNSYLLKCITETNAYWGWVKTTSARSGQPGINSKEYCSFQFALPPLAEQERIAEVLGCWDMAIEKQAALVDALTRRKRALMQQLLTARKRLPNFSAPWQKVKYSDILKEVKRKLVWDDNELYRLISVKRRSGGLFERESLYGNQIKTKNLRPALSGDFLISKMQIVHGASGLTTSKFDNMKISGSYIALIAKDSQKINMEYLDWCSKMPYFYHQTYISSYGVHIEKMTFDLESFMALDIIIPNIEEQKAIAQILTTADQEIESAKTKLEALLTQKRALMQQLLTGKKRLKI